MSGAKIMDSKRENLVVVRAGDASLHPQWLGKDSRTFDLAVSYYGDYSDRYRHQYDLIHLEKGSKWEGISSFCKHYRDVIRQYRYVWFPDDDLFTRSQNIDNFFSWCNKLDLTISQPALTPYSYISWEITRQEPGAVCRITDFVEIMAPCFRVDRLDLFVDTFSLNISGFGLEWVWADIARRTNTFRLGIVDAAPVFHTRPVGSAGHGGARNSPHEEMRLLLEKKGLMATRPKVLARYVDASKVESTRLSKLLTPK